MSAPTNTDDIIDGRDIAARIEELEADAQDNGDLLGSTDPEAVAELAVLKALASECEGCDDFPDGGTLIRDSYFEDYAQQFADDCGMVPDNLHWPMTYIDWERAASELQHNYTSVDFDGETYWIRS